MTRTPEQQLTTARLLLAMFTEQLREHEETGAHADRIDGLREGHKTWTERVQELETQLRPAEPPTEP